MGFSRADAEGEGVVRWSPSAVKFFLPPLPRRTLRLPSPSTTKCNQLGCHSGSRGMYVCIAPTPPSTTAILRVLNSIKFSSVWLSWEMERGDEGGRRVRSFPSDSFVSGLSSCNPFRQNILHNPPSFLPSLSLVGSTFLRIGRPHIRHAFTGFIFENNDEEPDSLHAVDRPFFIAHSLIIFPAAQANWKHLFSSPLRPPVRR